MKAKVSEELKQHFRPEFLNRVDDIIVFHQLSREEIFSIVDLMIAKVDERLKDRDMGIELRPAAKDAAVRARATTRCSAPGRCAGRSSGRSRTTCPRRSCSASSGRARSSWSTSEGTGPEAQFTFKGVPKPDAVPDVPPAEIDSKAAAGDRRTPGQRRVTSPGQRLSSPSRGVLRSLTRLRRGPPATGTWPWRGFARRSAGAGNAAMACDLELPLPRRSCRRTGLPGVRLRR